MDGDAPSPLRSRLQVLEGGSTPGRRKPVRLTLLRDPATARHAPDRVDLPRPGAPMSHLEHAIAALRDAAQAETITGRSDGVIDALDHLTRELAVLFDEEVARTALLRISGQLRRPR
jgi:hypothetical protein